MRLLAPNRRQEGEACCLPSELWLHVFRHMDRDWILEDNRRPKPWLKSGCGGGGGGSSDDVEHCAATGSTQYNYRGQSARQIESELVRTMEMLDMLDVACKGDPMARAVSASMLQDLADKRDAQLQALKHEHNVEVQPFRTAMGRMLVPPPPPPPPPAAGDD